MSEFRQFLKFIIPFMFFVCLIVGSICFLGIYVEGKAKSSYLKTKNIYVPWHQSAFLVVHIGNIEIDKK